MLIAVSVVAAAYPQAPVSPKRALLVYYTHGSFPGHLTFEESLLENLYSAVAPNLEFYREQLDSARFPEYTERKIAEFRSRYAKRKIDVVVYFGNVPTEILPGTPVVQVDNGASKLAVRDVYHGNSVNVSFNVDARKTVDIARRLQPTARKVLLIGGATNSDRVDVEQFRKRLTGERNLEIEVVNNLSVPDLRALVSRLSRNVIVLPVAYSGDPQGQSYLSRDVVRQVAEASTAPVYGISDTYVGLGAVGGYVVNWGKTGEVAADAAAQILSGRSPAEVVLKAPGSGVYMFDWRQLNRWGFSEHDLPPGSIVEYKLPSVWEQYRWRIIIVGALLVAQFVLTISLLIQRYKRRHAEESLRDMAGRLLRSQDDERRRIARDLHDGTGQHLSGIALSLGQILADFPPGHSRLRQLLEDSHIASRQALNEVRAVSYSLHPPILDGLKLIPALEWYLDGLRKRTGFSVDFQAPADTVISNPQAETALFRIVQESVTNVLRHSGGNAMRVRLSNGGKGIVLEIEDNGHGMSTEELERVEGATSPGVGVAGMRERVYELKGKFSISSNSQGTRVLVSLPTTGKKYAAHTAGG